MTHSQLLTWKLLLNESQQSGFYDRLVIRKWTDPNSFLMFYGCVNSVSCVQCWIDVYRWLSRPSRLATFYHTHDYGLFAKLFVFQLTMNDFSVHRIIGRGGFGEVYGCRKADTGKMWVHQRTKRARPCCDCWCVTRSVWMSGTPWSVWTRRGSRWSRGRHWRSTNESCFRWSAQGWVQCSRGTLLSASAVGITLWKLFNHWYLLTFTMFS